MTDITPTPQPLDLDLDAVVHSVVIAWEDFGGNIERMILERLRPEVEALRTERDEALAVIERAKVATADRYDQMFRVYEALSAAPSEALAEVKREAAAPREEWAYECAHGPGCLCGTGQHFRAGRS